MFKDLKNYIQGSEISALYVNKATGEWMPSQAAGFTLMAREDILSLPEGEPSKTEPENTGGKQKKSKKEAAE